MKPKHIIPRAAARQDAEEAIDYYLSAHSKQTASKFIDALSEAYAHIAHYPSTGSPRYANALDIPGLRSWKLKKYPYIVFYVAYDDHIDVWRILHEVKNIPTGLRESDDPA